MAQNRDAPAYQEYAASVMAKTPYRVLNLTERGLLYTLKLECWVNRRLPADPAMLARVLGFGADEIAMALPKVMPFFARDGTDLVCPELEDYRDHLDGRREKLSEAGKKGAAKTNTRHVAAGSATPAPMSRPGRGPLVQQSTDKLSTAEPRKSVLNGETEDDWRNDYEQASRGY